MKKCEKNYRQKTKMKTITFYLHEAKLFEFAQTINFQKTVKDMLKQKMEELQNGK